MYFERRAVYDQSCECNKGDLHGGDKEYFSDTIAAQEQRMKPTGGRLMVDEINLPDSQ
jgi:hypothetical protein